MHLIPVYKAKLPQALGPTASPTFAGMTLSGLTPGSVPFAGAGGLLSQDNAKLFWDNTNKRLGIGTAAPTQSLDVVTGHIQHKGQGHLLYQDIDTAGLAAANDLTGVRFSRGGISTLMGGIHFIGATYSNANRRNMLEIFNYLAAGGIDFNIGAGINDTTRTLRLDVNKNILTGGLIAAGASATKSLALASGTAPTGNLTDAIQIYAQDFAAGNACLYVRSEDGTVMGFNQSMLTTASPVFAGFSVIGSGTRLVTIESTGAANIAALSLKNATLNFNLETGREGNDIFGIYAGGGVGVSRLVIKSTGQVGIGTVNPTLSGTGKLHIGGDCFRVDTARTPASAGATGNAGEICWDANYIYVCIATNTWKRAAISTW